MCRYACKDPSTCKIARFTISPVKEGQNNSSSSIPLFSSPPQFVRNQNVKFFSPASDSDSEDEFPAVGQQYADWGPPSAGQQKNVSFPSAFVDSSSADSAILLPSNSPSASSSDSGFVETCADGKEEEEESDSSNSSTTSCAEVIKSILMAPKGEREEGGEKKKVRFADDCGHCLVRCRSIQSRRIDALYADFVQIGPIDEESSGNGPWRVALLRKLWGITTTSTNNNQSSTTTTTTGEPIICQRG